MHVLAPHHAEGYHWIVAASHWILDRLKEEFGIVVA
jgi:hypothetical protein